MTSRLPGQALAVDTASMARLRTQAGADPKAAIREAARQFEALFMQEVMKSMRAATQASGWMDNEGSRLGTEMLDAQWAQQMTGMPGGLSRSIEQQLQRQMGLEPGLLPQMKKPLATVESTVQAAARQRIPGTAAAAFVQQHQATAEAVSQSSGIPAAYLLAQAGHETGWGARPILKSDGSNSHNLFGIKAGPGWQGEVAESLSTEVVGGQAVKSVERFRAYASPRAAFEDFARLIKGNERYRAAASAGADAKAYSEGLQKGGYATDPLYASKLQRTINTTLDVMRSRLTP